jgi:hypothetical protein
LIDYVRVRFPESSFPNELGMNDLKDEENRKSETLRYKNNTRILFIKLNGTLFLVEFKYYFKAFKSIKVDHVVILQ